MWNGNEGGSELEENPIFKRILARNRYRADEMAALEEKQPFRRSNRSRPINAECCSNRDGMPRSIFPSNMIVCPKNSHVPPHSGLRNGDRFTERCLESMAGNTIASPSAKDERSSNPNSGPKRASQSHRAERPATGDYSGRQNAEGYTRNSFQNITELSPRKTASASIQKASRRLLGEKTANQVEPLPSQGRSSKASRGTSRKKRKTKSRPIQQTSGLYEKETKSRPIQRPSGQHKGEANSAPIQQNSKQPARETNSLPIQQNSGQHEKEMRSRPIRQTSVQPEKEANSAPIQQNSKLPAGETKSLPSQQTSGQPESETRSPPIRQTSGQPARETRPQPIQQTSGRPAREARSPPSQQNSEQPAREATSRPIKHTSRKAEIEMTSPAYQQAVRYSQKLPENKQRQTLLVRNVRRSGRQEICEVRSEGRRRRQGVCIQTDNTRADRTFVRVLNKRF